MSQNPAMSKRLRPFLFVFLTGFLFMVLFVETTFIWAISITLPFLIVEAIFHRILVLQVFIDECDGVGICLHIVVGAFGYTIKTRLVRGVVSIRRCTVIVNASDAPLTKQTLLYGKRSDGREVLLLGGAGLGFLFNIKDKDIAELMDACKQKGINIVSPEDFARSEIRKRLGDERDTKE